MATYTFGDDSAAVERMTLVASAYEPTSRTFLAQHLLHSVGVALDLGCGPGLSSQLLYSVCRPRTLIGIDSSSKFIGVARGRLPPASFETHDVTATPLPAAPVDVIYARLVLAHLPDPLGTAERWRRDLAAGGVLLIEELEEIETPPGPLATYDEASSAIVRRGGGVMYAGRALSPLGGQLARVMVPAALAATIYLFNVERWVKDLADQEDSDQLIQLEADLRKLIHENPETTVSWIVRQVAVRA